MKTQIAISGGDCFQKLTSGLGRYHQNMQILNIGLWKYLVKSEKPRFWMNKYEWFTALYFFDTGCLVFNHALLHINSDRLSLREKNWVLVLYI